MRTAYHDNGVKNFHLSKLLYILSDEFFESHEDMYDVVAGLRVFRVTTFFGVDSFSIQNLNVTNGVEPFVMESPLKIRSSINPEYVLKYMLYLLNDIQI